MIRRFPWTVAVMLAALPTLAVAGGAFADGFPQSSEAEYVGSESCLDCHDDAAEFFHATPHSLNRGLVIPGTEISSCEACHGPGGAHIDAEGDGAIIGGTVLATMSVAERRGMCTQCHTAQAGVWHAGPHASADIDCWSCHGDVVHASEAVRPARDFRISGEFCLQCHAEEIAAFRMPYRHRVLEGEVTCLDCHSAHGEMEATFGVDGRNEACFRCHTEMAGPFVFEHDGVSGEDCTECHVAHGSINDKLLVQDSNGLCLQCHYQEEFPTMGDANHGSLLGSQKLCFECHREVHGSNIDPNFQNR